jgi:hypothetical protein
MEKNMQDIKNLLRTLGKIVDRLENRTGVAVPGWLALDVFASSCADADITVRKCCRRNMQSQGLLSSNYLVLNDRITVTCTPFNEPGSTAFNRIRKTGKTRRIFGPVSSRRYRNSRFDFYILPERKDGQQTACNIQS